MLQGTYDKSSKDDAKMYDAKIQRQLMWFEVLNPVKSWT